MLLRCGGNYTITSNRLDNDTGKSSCRHRADANPNLPVNHFILEWILSLICYWRQESELQS